MGPDSAARRPGATRTWSLALALTALLPAPSTLAQFVAPEGSDFHNGSTFPGQDLGPAGAWLVRLDEALLVGDGDEAADVLAGLRRREDADLVPFGPRTVVPALDLAARRILERGDPDLIDHVLAVEAAAIARARAERDLPTLLDHATRTPALQTSAEATWVAARLLFEQGRWWEAASLGRRLLPRPGAAALVAAAEAELPDDRPSPTRGPWDGTMTLKLPRDPYPRAEALPRLLDGRPGETLVLDDRGLQGFDLTAEGPALTRTFERFDWLRDYLRPQGPFTAHPAPRRYDAVVRGGRVVVPFNAAIEDWRGPEGAREARLLCLDLDDPDERGVPRLVWELRLPPDDAGSSAFGVPVLVGERVVLPVFRIGLRAEVSLAAVSLERGELLYETPLVQGTDVRRFASRRAQLAADDIDKRAREGALAVADGVAHVCTGFGAVAAVDLLTGRVLHAFRYDRRFAQERAVYHPAFLFDTGGWDHEPVRLWGERVVVAPSDSRFLYMLAREPGPGGQLILEDPIERLDRRHVVTLRPDPGGGEAPAVLATRVRDGRGSLVLLDPHGHTLATSQPLPAGESFTGRPLVTESGVVVVPTSAGLRLYAARSPTTPAVLIPRPAELKAPRQVMALESGLVILHPEPQRVVYAVHWKQVR